MAPRRPYPPRELLAIGAIFAAAIAYSWWRHYWLVRHDEAWRLGSQHTWVYYKWFYFTEPLIFLAAYGVFLGGRALWRRRREK